MMHGICCLLLLEDVLVEELASFQVGLEFMCVLVLLDSDGGSESRSWFESAVSDDGEDIGDVVSEAVSLEVGGFLVVLHLEGATGLLDDTAGRRGSRRAG